jgi:hypothetical protein
MKGFVPTSRLAPYLRAAVEELYPDKAVHNETAGWRKVPDPTEGILRRTLHRWENEIEYVSFSSADTILCQVYCSDIWYHDLADLYEAVNLGETCSKGHEMTEENAATYTDKRNGATYTRCRTCDKAKNQAYKARQLSVA